LPLVLLRDRPLELRFSQPLAKATAETLKAPARAWIAREDPKVLRLEVKDAAPGQQLAVRLVDLVGINGAPAPEYEVVIETPQPVALASVSDHAVASQIKLPPDVAITLGWSRSVVSVEYRVGDKTAAWHGEATTTVELPVRARAAESQMLTILDAVAADGGWLPAALTFELSPLPPLGLVNLWPVDGATNVSVTGDPTFRFNEPIANSAAAEAAISFSPSVPGRFEWLTSDRVRFLPEDSFAPETQFTVHINGGSDGMRGVSGSALAESVTTTFETGKRKAIEVSLGKQILTLYEDDTPVWTAPVATGVRGAETPLGDYQVQYKMPQARFKGTNPDGSRYDIPDVHWVMPFYGDYTIHGAYWRSVFGRPGSAGCISLTDPNAKYVFDWADERTPVYIRA
jgi:lipoprotein-anchoring transpeptidase ErfK/SrfK